MDFPACGHADKPPRCEHSQGLLISDKPRPLCGQYNPPIPTPKGTIPLTFSEAPLSVNFKPGKDYDAPLLTIRGNDPHDLAQRVSDTEESPLFGNIVNAASAFKAAYNVSTILGGESVPQAPAPAPQEAPQGGFPAPQQAWGAPAPQQGYAAPQQAAPAAPASGASAGAPFIPAFGMTATFRSGQGAKGPWSAYFDPRPKNVTDAIPADYTGKVPSTDDVNHPGLAGGTHKFARFIR